MGWSSAARRSVPVVKEKRHHCHLFGDYRGPARGGRIGNEPTTGRSVTRESLTSHLARWPHWLARYPLGHPLHRSPPARNPETRLTWLDLRRVGHHLGSLSLPALMAEL